MIRPACSGQVRLIEKDAFPFEFISGVAERESWRKEIYRPIYHLHRWWANRLGSVFRGILIGCVLPENADLKKAFYQEHDFGDFSVLDPFMGSGTTIGEAHKLGFAALGRDINPVACESVRVSLGPLNRQRLLEAFECLAGTVGNRIKGLYKSKDERGRVCDVLYYFWVKVVHCNLCGASVDLFPSRVIARNAYPARKPEIQVCCPRCGGIFPARNHDTRVRCSHCDFQFDPNEGYASGAKATCPACAGSFQIIDAVRKAGCPPHHRLYGKLVLTGAGDKKYLAATPYDIKEYERCSHLLQAELRRGSIRVPDGALSDGHNTRQAIGYNYRNWRDFFNDRQLLALGWLQKAIAATPDLPTRDALFNLFSGVLEINNLFASYKGEGTGAVRHMFAHHILKPERVPIEANVWGTPKSSGSFSNLFKARLLRAMDYRDSPFEATTTGRGKVYISGAGFSGNVRQWPLLPPFEPRGIYLSCRSSDDTGLPDRSVDLVVTDPPFFDNVHYSELADFFYAWQRLYPRGLINGATTTRDRREVQDADPARFAAKLQAVFRECRRILRDNGILVFTYHHSRPEGWASLFSAVFGAGFSVVNAHPVKAELSVAAPKSQAKEPIQIDVILVCRKREEDARRPVSARGAVAKAARIAKEKADRLMTVGLRLSLNDRRVIAVSQFMAAIGPVASDDSAARFLAECHDRLEEIALGIPRCSDSGVKPTRPTQLALF